MIQNEKCRENIRFSFTLKIKWTSSWRSLKGGKKCLSCDLTSTAMNTNEINSEKTIENDSVGATATSVREEAPVFSVILIQKKRDSYVVVHVRPCTPLWNETHSDEKRTFAENTITRVAAIK